MSLARQFNTRPLYLQVADEFIGRIVRGEWSAGQTIDNEADIARSLGISVGTARKAFDILVDYKLLERHQGRGSVVPDLTKGEGRARFSNLHTVEGGRLTGETSVHDARVEMPDGLVAGRLGVNERTPVLAFERRRSHRGRVFMREAVFLRLRVNLGSADEEALLKAAEERWHGLDLATAMSETVAVSSADEADAALFGIAAQTPILLLERVITSYQERPLEFRRARCHLGDDILYKAH